MDDFFYFRVRIFILIYRIFLLFPYFQMTNIVLQHGHPTPMELLHHACRLLANKVRHGWCLYFLIDYFNKIFIQNGNGSDEKNALQNFWNSSLGLCTMATNFAMCFLTTILMVIISIDSFPKKFSNLFLQGKVSKAIRFYVPMVGIGVCFVFCAVMAVMDCSEWVLQFFITTLSITIVITMFCAIFQCSLVCKLL